MSFFKDRSDYFKSLAQKHKLVAHGAVAGKGSRNSFHRMNDEEELLAACTNWAHFPCVVHIAFAGRYTSEKQGMVKRKHTNSLLFLEKCDHPTDMDSRETAYDAAFEVMEDFISAMNEEMIQKGYCGNFHSLDLGRFSFYPTSANGLLFGWSLTFDDDVFATVTRFESNKWLP